MNTPTSRRKVKLVNALAAGRPFIEADLYRDCPSAELESIEEQWAKAREQVAAAGLTAGLTPLEHAHWDWRNKANSVEALRHRLVAVECEGETQGIMAVPRAPRRAVLHAGQVVYVDYVESAPWNLKTSTSSPRFVGVGTVLIADAIRLSLEMGLGGRVGLHSLPQAEPFYLRCRMTPVGPDPYYHDLMYFEFTDLQASEWLFAIGETP